MYEPVRNALEAVGNKHKYQYLMTVLLLCLNYCSNFITIGGTFIFMNPLFRCSFSQSLVDESVACDRLPECAITSDFTIAARMELYCSQQYLRNFMQSILALGSVFGLLVVNYLSDHKGKKASILTIQAVAILGFSVTLLGAEVKSVGLLLVGQALCGFSSFSMLLSTYLYPSECCDDVFRQRAVVAVNYSWSFSFCILGVLYYWCNYWRNFLLYFCLIPLIVVFVITLLFMVEGPNFLYGQNRIAQCLESLSFIAKVNGRMKQFEAVKHTIVSRTEHENQTTVIQNLKLLFKNKSYVKKLVIMISLEFGGNIYYFGSNYALDQIGYEYGTNLIAAGIIEALAIGSINFLIEKVSRKKAIFGFYGFLALLGFLFLIPAVRETLLGQAIILGVVRYLVTIAYMVIIVTLTELFPMNVQSVCSGVVESLAQLGILVGPVIVTLCINLQIYPMIVLSVVLIVFVVVPVLGLDETMRVQKDQILLQTQTEQP